LQQEGKIEVEFLLTQGGELLAEFERLAKTHMHYSAAEKSLKDKVKRIFFNTADKDISTLSWNEYDYVIANTITNGDVLEEMRQYYKGPIISYIHELQLSAKTFSNAAAVKKVISFSDHFLVPCLALQTFLEDSFEVPENKISILPYYMPLKKNDKAEPKAKNKTFKVGGAGTTDWRKGPDLFIQVAASIKKNEPNVAIQFVWKGTNKNSLEHAKLQHDIDKLGLSEMVLMEEPVKELDIFFESLDIFFLSSREDPYPLVVLDAANYNLPTICFNDAGGIPEFVEKSGGGISVDYMDIGKAADAILNYYKNVAAKEHDGNLAKEYLFKTHQNSGAFVEKLINICEKLN
jgi:glycosyltransferase involved in cell wall biosynthesis